MASFFEVDVDPLRSIQEDEEAGFATPNKLPLAAPVSAAQATAVGGAAATAQPAQASEFLAFVSQITKAESKVQALHIIGVP
jgi:hypothetical protein